jgi:hypothetical protein
MHERETTQPHCSDDNGAALPRSGRRRNCAPSFANKHEISFCPEHEGSKFDLPLSNKQASLSALRNDERAAKKCTSDCKPLHRFAL